VGCGRVCRRLCSHRAAVSPPSRRRPSPPHGYGHGRPLGEPPSPVQRLRPAPRATAAASPTPTAGGSAPASPSSAWAGSIFGRGSLPHRTGELLRYVPLVISGGQLLSVKYPPVADPYPLYAPPMRRTISQTGLTTIVGEAQHDGLLGSVTSFVCPHGANDPMMAGTGADYLVLIGGRRNPRDPASCPYEQPTPGPGSPAPARRGLPSSTSRISSPDPASWLGAEVGPGNAVDPAQLAVLAMISSSRQRFQTSADVGPVAAGRRHSLLRIASFGRPLRVAAGLDAATLLRFVKAVDATNGIPRSERAPSRN